MFFFIFLNTLNIFILYSVPGKPNNFSRSSSVAYGSSVMVILIPSGLCCVCLVIFIKSSWSLAIYLEKLFDI